MKVRKDILPVLKPHATQVDIDGVTEVLKSGWWGNGNKTKLLEEQIKEITGVKHAIAINSNSAGQDLVIKALGLGPGDDIISPTMSFMATAMIPLWSGCTSNIVDIRQHDLNIDPEDVKKCLKPNTKMITCVDMGGVPAPIEEIREFYDGFILQDMAHSVPHKDCLKGDVGVFSFQSVKVIPSGDGGMIITNDDDLAEKLRKMTWFGVSSTFSRTQEKNKGSASYKPGYTWSYEVDNIGYKCYMIDIIASLCLTQLDNLDANLDKRRAIRDQYNEYLNPKYFTNPPHSKTVQYYGARVSSEHRNKLIDYLADKNIHTSVHFKPLHHYKVMQENAVFPNREYPVADEIWKELISLPVHQGMSFKDVDYVIYWCNQYFKEVYGEDV